MKTNLESKYWFNVIKNAYECGMIDLIGAMQTIISYYQDGRFAYDEAEEAIQKITKIKIK